MLAGLSQEECVKDEKASKYELPEIDGVNVWPLVAGINSTSPRVGFPISSEAYMSGEYKLIVGSKIGDASWQGEMYPNASSVNNTQMADIYADCSNGCLFNVAQDMTEHVDIASQNSNIVQQMKQELNNAKQSFFTNNDTGINSCPSNVTVECACWMAKYYWKEFFGPYQYLSDVDQL